MPRPSKSSWKLAICRFSVIGNNILASIINQKNQPQNSFWVVVFYSRIGTAAASTATETINSVANFILTCDSVPTGFQHSNREKWPDLGQITALWKSGLWLSPSPPQSPPKVPCPLSTNVKHFLSEDGTPKPLRGVSRGSRSMSHYRR
jgi:hypothetical protein